MLVAATLARSQSIQKWVRPDGRIHFGDHPPAGSKLVGATDSLGTSGGGEIGSKDAQDNARAAKKAAEKQDASTYSSATWYEGADGYAAARERQRSSHASMLVYFHTDWCPHCKSFDGLLEEGTVRSRLAELIKVRINPERGKAEDALFKTDFRGTAFPTLFLVDAAGVRRQISHGGPAEKFLAQIPH